MGKGGRILDVVEMAMPFVMPAIGGAVAVVYINLNEMKFLNPLIWIPLGIVLGWAAGRLLLRLFGLLR
jgi:hypothetical protein